MNNIIYSTLSPCNPHHYEHGPLAWLHRWQHQALVWLSWNYRISKRYEKWIEHGHNWPLNSLTLYTRFWIDSYDQWSKSVGYLWIHWSFRKLYSFQDLTVHVKKVKFEENWLRKCVSLSFIEITIHVLKAAKIRYLNILFTISHFISRSYPFSSRSAPLSNHGAKFKIWGNCVVLSP